MALQPTFIASHVWHLDHAARVAAGESRAERARMMAVHARRERPARAVLLRLGPLVRQMRS